MPYDVILIRSFNFQHEIRYSLMEILLLVAFVIAGAIMVKKEKAEQSK